MIPYIGFAVYFDILTYNDVSIFVVICRNGRCVPSYNIFHAFYSDTLLRKMIWLPIKSNNNWEHRKQNCV